MALGERLGVPLDLEEPGNEGLIDELIAKGLLPPKQKRRTMLPQATGAVTSVVTPGAEIPSANPAASAQAQASLDAPLPQAGPVAPAQMAAPRRPMLPQATAQMPPQAAPAQAAAALPRAMGMRPQLEDPTALYNQAEAERAKGMAGMMPTEEEMGAGRKRAMLGQLGAQAMGLMGPGMSDAAAPMLKQSLEEAQMYTDNPFRRREMEAKKYEASAASKEKRAALAQSLAEKQYEVDEKLREGRITAQEAAAARKEIALMLGSLRSGASADAAQARLDQNITTRAAGLRNDFDPLVKDLRVSIQTYPQIQAALTQGTPSPASDMRAIFRYMKMLDPTSVVREGEYATAKNARGVPDKIANLYNSTMKGLILTPKQRADFLAQAKSEADTAQQSFDTQAKRFHDMARRIGVDPRDVTPGFDFTAGQPAAEEGVDVGDALKSGRVQGRRKNDYRPSNL